MAHNARDLPTEESGYVPDKLFKAHKRVAAYNFDIEAWSVLIRDAQMKNIEDARRVYEKLVTQFPNSGRYWKIYIEHEMKARNFEKVEKLFQRCLMKVLNIDLWKTYLNYIKETKGNLATYREKMAQAYDFALDKIGMDILSYQIWVDYINFLKSVEAVGSYAENQRITAVRKVYQRGIVNPMVNIEILWKEYCSFEQGINPLIAKKMQEDKGRDYMNARRVAKEYEVVTKGLNRNTPSIPPQNNIDELKQVDLWKKYISFEKSNPLRSEDQGLIARRVMFAYEQSLLCLGHHPDIWIEAAAYLEQTSRILTEKGDQNAGKLFADEAAAMYERAITTLLKSNQLLYFAYADFEESRMKHDKAHSIYKKLIQIVEADPTLPYLLYMKFARRAEGIKSARQVFKMAREDSRSKWQVFVAAALMEYYCSKDKNVAFKIFELGLKKYGEFPEYVLAYVDFMSHVNEDNNTRVLFERVLGSTMLPTDKQHEIWNRFLDFESEVGDLASIAKVEKRRAQVLGKVHTHSVKTTTVNIKEPGVSASSSQEFEGKETALLIDRYRYMDLLPCNPVELKAIGYNDVIKHHISSLPGTGLSDPGLSKKVCLDGEEPERAQYPMPDTSQMLPFKPRPNPIPGSHPVSGGIFPAPPTAAELMSRLPPPQCFQGPFLIIDDFIEHMTNLKLPEDGPKIENGVGPRLIDDGTKLSMDLAAGRKRKLDNNADDSDDDDGNKAPPMNDIYRSRQQKKVVK